MSPWRCNRNLQLGISEEAGWSRGEWFSLDHFICKSLFIISGWNEDHLCQRKQLNVICPLIAETYVNNELGHS